MKVSQIIFSPTGGTKKVADIITNTWGLPRSEERRVGKEC